MTEERNDEIKEAAKERANQYSHPVQWNDVYNGFISGAQWADNHPKNISMNYLHSWYQQSIDETVEPIWTDKHIEELYNDFYLIPKDRE